jgi:hypothetical protein
MSAVAIRRASRADRLSIGLRAQRGIETMLKLEDA